MSIYTPILSIDADDWDGVGLPFVYQGSHVLPREDNERGGWLDFASIPAFCGDDPAKLVDYLRVDAAPNEDGDPAVTLLLNRKQVELLVTRLNDWLTREVERG